ncbi:hypothetical protein [Hydrocarboniphaga effusa]|uniref:hypothetical protein n=1 Tax=Hydrocarboniphaga effusa TaxID=243629 RepID=UPI003BAAE538
MADRPRFSFKQKYSLGVELSRQLEPVCTLEELGAAIGVTKQNAYTESVLALGTLALLLMQMLGRTRAELIDEHAP